MSTAKSNAMLSGPLKTALITLFTFSLLFNLLMLTAPLYMLQVFDRVLQSGSTDTLLLLTGIAIAALVTLGVIGACRSYVGVRLGRWLEAFLAKSVFTISVEAAVQGRSSLQGIRDLTTVRGFLSGNALMPLVDAPWTPLFVLVIYLLHPMLGHVALVGVLLLGGLAVSVDLATRRLLQRSGSAGARGLEQAEAAVQNADVIRAMGMLDNWFTLWSRSHRSMLAEHTQAAERGAAITAFSKFIRMSLYVGMLGIGAYLVIQRELSAGAMIAASILMSRALAPVEMSIGSWRSAVMAHAAFRRLQPFLALAGKSKAPMSLPEPKGELRIEGVTFAYPDSIEPLLKHIAFGLEPGESLGILGPSGSGKTTLVRLLVGNFAPRLGHVRLDGADVARWAPTDRGQYMGYLPQDVELFEGSVRLNIARMDASAPGEQVIEAATLAGVHDMILRLPDGYETHIGPGGAGLSAGQRQRIGLARALFGDVRLLVLDEPNSNLDQVGEVALIGLVAEMKGRGVTTVVVAHRPSILQACDKLLVLEQGTVRAFGPREKLMPRLTRVAPAAVANTSEESCHVQ